MRHEQTSVTVAVSCDREASPDAPQIPSGTEGPNDSESATTTPSDTKKSPTPANSNPSQSLQLVPLQLVRVSVPDEQSQLNALRLLADSPSPATEPE